MEKKKKRSIEALEQALDQKLTVAEMYANRPRKWLLYLAIVLVIVLLVGWSAKDIRFTGLTVTGTEVAKGVLHGVFSPDTGLLFGTKATDVPYLPSRLPCSERCSARCLRFLSRFLPRSISCRNP